ncbi:hypothetical protein CROQUDRAFT_95518 [Cronartium quercuum f. sp. fusiforme G11]|uniref:YTH domain-containing protein n=1 Tax=Cronartium quercuum f. sp. fusiforme G11 TaxID=708437 RepID=A0A9P6T9B4_9BASI|nr:hypothetical protein CROQUDRAFT_95518 [Cronartium quercuum f. sp. fusiforme G11]
MVNDHSANTAFSAMNVTRTDNSSSPSSSSSYAYVSSPLDHTTCSPIGTPPVPAPNHLFNPLLRRHHTLSTGSGSRLARLEEQQALAHLANRDRQTYGSSADGSSLSGYDSEDSDPLEAHRSSILPTPPAERCMPFLTSVLEHHQVNVTSPHSSLFDDFHLIRACKGSASLLNHDVIGSPIDSEIVAPPKSIPTSEDGESLTKPPSRTVRHEPGQLLSFSDRLDAIGDRHQHRFGGIPLSSQFGLHRNLSSPSNRSPATFTLPSPFHSSQTSWTTQLQGCVGSKIPSMNSSHPSLRHRPSTLTDYGPTTETLEEEEEEDYVAEPEPIITLGLLRLCSVSIVSPCRRAPTLLPLLVASNSPTFYLFDPSPLTLFFFICSVCPSRAVLFPHLRSNFRKSVQSSPSDPSHHEPALSDSLPPSSVTLQRATSERVSSTRNRFQAPSRSNPSSISRWSDHANLRRQPMKTDGVWSTGMVTNSMSAGNQTDESPRSTDPNFNTSIDTLYSASSPPAPTSADALRSTPNLSVSSNITSHFTQKLLSNSPPSVHPVSYTTHSGSVTPIGSPVSVPAFSLNPWSPTVEEAKKLRDPMLRQASVDVVGSGQSVSPRPSKSATLDTNRFRSASGDDSKSSDLNNMMHSSFNRLGLSTSEELNPRPSLPSSTAHRHTPAKSPLSISTSMADVVSGITSPQDVMTKSSTSNKKMILPPLVTTFPQQPLAPSTRPIGSTPPSVDTTKRTGGASSIPFQGPASAAAYVPPIGHSLQHNPNDPFNLQEKLARMGGHNTAAPGVGASTWLSQKERLVGKPSFSQHQEWNSPILSAGGSPSLPQSAAPLSALPHQIQQQMLLNQQLQQLQQLQAQQQLLQQQQVQLLSQGMGLSAGLTNPLTTNLFHQTPTPSTASSFNMHPIGSALQSNGYSPSLGFPANQFTPRNVSPVGPNVSINYGSIGSSSNPPLASNPSRLQTTITGHPGVQLGMMSLSSPSSLISNSIPTPVGMRNPLGLNGVIAGGMAGTNVSPSTSVDIQQLANRKGYNPPNFDCKPKKARFFVIKSYTEEDVHKSLKYEIWASTDLGNKRLDKAFNESAETGPIYLLFSVNASGHFCGMAEMLTAVDYNTSSKVWAQDKWKGIFKVRWVFVKDIPNNSLRHIKLCNTPENKPVTSSRDTQEVPYDKGIEVLQIMSSYQSRTTLLQDYAWYEHNENLKAQATEPNTAAAKDEQPVQRAPQPKPAADKRGQANHRTGYAKGQGPTPTAQTIRRFSAFSNTPQAGLPVYHHPQTPIEIASVI